VIAAIVVDIYLFEGIHYVYMIISTIASALLVYIDHHWSCVVKFYATYP
jgi:hypothetical protein